MMSKRKIASSYAQLHLLESLLRINVSYNARVQTFLLILPQEPAQNVIHPAKVAQVQV